MTPYTNYASTQAHSKFTPGRETASGFLLGGCLVDYSPQLAALICERIADGRSLRDICADDDMPVKSSILKWLGLHQDFADQYARAREAQADHFAEEILDIADDGTNDWMKRQQGEETVEVANHEHISRSKLRVDARKWLMSKMAPKKYGDKITQEVTGADGAPLVPVLNVSIGGAGPKPSSEAGDGSQH